MTTFCPSIHPFPTTHPEFGCGGSRLSKVYELHSLAKVFWVYPRASYQLDMPVKPPLGGWVQEFFKVFLWAVSQSLPPSNLQLHGGDPVILQGELQHTEYPHTPHTLRKRSKPAPLQNFGSKASTVRSEPAISNWYRSTSRTNCGFSLPARWRYTSLRLIYGGKEQNYQVLTLACCSASITSSPVSSPCRWWAHRLLFFVETGSCLHPNDQNTEYYENVYLEDTIDGCNMELGLQSNCPSLSVIKLASVFSYHLLCWEIFQWCTSTKTYLSGRIKVVKMLFKNVVAGIQSWCACTVAGHIWWACVSTIPLVRIWALSILMGILDRQQVCM